MVKLFASLHLIFRANDVHLFRLCTRTFAAQSPHLLQLHRRGSGTPRELFTISPALHRPAQTSSVTFSHSSCSFSELYSKHEKGEPVEPPRTRTSKVFSKVERAFLKKCFHVDLISKSSMEPTDTRLSFEEWDSFVRLAMKKLVQQKTVIVSAIVGVLSKYELSMAGMSLLHFLAQPRSQSEIMEIPTLPAACLIELTHILELSPGDEHCRNEFISAVLANVDYLHDQHALGRLVSALVDTERWRDVWPIISTTLSNKVLPSTEAEAPGPSVKQLSNTALPYTYSRLGPARTADHRTIDLSGVRTYVESAAVLLERTLLQDDLNFSRDIVLFISSVYSQRTFFSSTPSPVNPVLSVLLQYALRKCPSPESSSSSLSQSALDEQSVKAMVDLFFEGLNNGQLILSQANASLLQQLGSVMGFKTSMTRFSDQSPSCANCGSSYPTSLLEPSDVESLRQGIASLQHGSQLFQHTQPQEIRAFSRLLSLGPHIDYVVDGLNVAGAKNYTVAGTENYARVGGSGSVGHRSTVRHTFSREMLSDFLNHFCALRKKQVLIVGKNNMWSLISPNLRKLNNLQMFVVEKSTADDLYIILAALTCPRATLVSNDFYLDQRAKLPNNLKYLFTQWQRTHQQMFAGIGADKVPILRKSDPALTHPHPTRTGWHLPVGFDDPDDHMAYLKSHALGRGVGPLPNVPPNNWLCIEDWNTDPSSK